MMWVKRIGCVVVALVLFDQALGMLASWQGANQQRINAAAEGLR